LKILLFLSTVILMGQSVLATSAYREPNTDFHEYLELQKNIIKNKKIKAKRFGFGNFDSVTDKAQSLAEFNAEQVFATQISSEQAKELFIYMRDKRDLIDRANFKRRITWLYPDDGCYVRSAIMQSLIKEKTGESWSQIFVFGNLELQTKYSEVGSVTWWYHVAPVVRTDKGIFVFDPSVNTKAPMALKDWLSKVNADTDASIAICDANAYIPDSSCVQEETNHRDEALIEEKEVFFANEWNRLINLGLQPEEILGEKPPWK
jgi:hypothetical protein